MSAGRLANTLNPVARAGFFGAGGAQQAVRIGAGVMGAGGPARVGSGDECWVNLGPGLRKGGSLEGWEEEAEGRRTWTLKEERIPHPLEGPLLPRPAELQEERRRALPCARWLTSEEIATSSSK